MFPEIFLLQTFLSQRIRKIDKATGIVTTVAGDGLNNPSPDGQPAVSTSLKNPSDVIMDNSGNVVLVDELDQRLRMTDRNTGILTSLAGTGYVGYGQDCVQANNPSYRNAQQRSDGCFRHSVF